MCKRFVFVTSTSGSVMSQVLKTQTVRNATHSVIADRRCAAINVAQSFGLNAIVYDDDNNEDFCKKLLAYINQNKVDYVISFYTKFYSADIREELEDRIINFHPSLLPAFKGMDGFGDGYRYHTKIIGTTVEFIKDVMDEGKIVMQTALPVNKNISVSELRHKIFVQQCKTLVQVVDWLQNDRIEVDGSEVRVRNAKFEGVEFVPALENEESLALEIPYKREFVRDTIPVVA